MEASPNQEKIVNWIRPDIENERGEIERVIKDFLGLEPNEENIKRIIEILTTAPISDLSDEEWEQLDNTDSFHNVRPGHIEDAEQLTDKYNEDLSVENKRDFKSLLDGFTKDQAMETPVILKNEMGKTHLVSGNTRLMISRALGIRPKVVMCEAK